MIHITEFEGAVHLHLASALTLNALLVIHKIVTAVKGTLTGWFYVST